MSVFTVFGVLSEQRVQVWCSTLILKQFVTVKVLLPFLCCVFWTASCLLFLINFEIIWNLFLPEIIQYSNRYTSFLIKAYLNSCIAYFKSLLPNRIKSVQSSIPHVSLLLKRIWVNGFRDGAIEMYWCWGFSNCCF